MTTVQTQDELAPWRISGLSFPGREAPAPEKLAFLIGYAVLAPSSHNTQPWLFRLCADHVDVCADRTRALPVVDPHDRELVMSCGAALFNLRMAARHFGYLTTVELLPDPDHHDLLARVALGQTKPSTHEENTLFAAIPRRRTNRLPFERTPLDRKLLDRLEAAANAEGAWLHIVRERRDRHAVADLIADGDRLQFADKRFRRELAAWVHSNRSHSHDGMPGYAHGHGDLMSMLESFVIRTFDLGKGVGAKDKDLAEHSPVLAVLGTDADAAADWLRAGQALQHVLLLAASGGVDASFLNQPIEVESLRPRLARTIDHAGFPQILLRMGRGQEIKATPRRGVAEVLRRA